MSTSASITHPSSKSNQQTTNDHAGDICEVSDYFVCIKEGESYVAQLNLLMVYLTEDGW